jgi:hypothetical protein
MGDFYGKRVFRQSGYFRFAVIRPELAQKAILTDDTSMSNSRKRRSQFVPNYAGLKGLFLRSADLFIGSPKSPSPVEACIDVLNSTVIGCRGVSRISARTCAGACRSAAQCKQETQPHEETQPTKKSRQALKPTLHWATAHLEFAV